MVIIIVLIIIVLAYIGETGLAIAGGREHHSAHRNKHKEIATNNSNISIVDYSPKYRRFFEELVNDPTVYPQMGNGKQWNKQKIDRFLGYKDTHLQCILSSGNPAGVIWSHTENPEFYPGSEISNKSIFIAMIVHPDYRRQGVAKNACILFLKKFKKYIPVIYSSVLQTNEASNAMFRSLGWKKIPTDKNGVYLYKYDNMSSES